MGMIIAVANQKGGVGKTTTAVNLGASLAALGKRILLVDLDPQGNATMGCGVDKHGLKSTTCDVLLGEKQIRETAVHSKEANLDVLPANGDLTAAEVGLMGLPMKDKRLNLALSGIRDEYDYIIIDCPPSLNMLTVNAMVAAEGVVIPIQTEYYALEGLSALASTIDQVRVARNPKISILGILRTMHDPRNNLANEVSAQLISHFGEQVFRTIVPRNVRVAEAPSHGLPVLRYDRASRGAIAYLALASELLRRLEKRQPAATSGS